MKKEYELIWEIFNKCPRNQMRDRKSTGRRYDHF